MPGYFYRSLQCDLTLMDALDSSTLAQSEMQNVVHYYENRIYTIEEIMDSISQQGSEYGRGAYALLFNLHHSAKEHLEKCNHRFSSTCLHEVPLLETVNMDSLSECESGDSDSNSTDSDVDI